MTNRIPHQAVTEHEGITTGFEWITPELAEEILSRNVNNRPLSMRRVRSLVEQIKAGAWSVINQGIGIADNGDLIDGQHRLTAIVLSGTPVMMNVMRGMKKSSAQVIDSGAKRTPSDVFGIAGIPQRKTQSSGTKVYWLYKNHPDKVWNNNVLVPSANGLLEYWHSDIGSERGQQANGIAEYARRSFQPLTASVVYALTLIMEDSGHQHHAIRHFFDKIVTGANLDDLQPTLVWRNSVLNETRKVSFESARTKSSLAWQQILLAQLIKVFNYENDGVRKRLIRTPEFPPMPVVERA